MNRSTADREILRQTPLKAETAHGTLAQSTVQSPVLVLLDAKQAAATLGISERKFHALRASKAPWLPKPIALGPRLLRWPRAELEAAVVAAPRFEGADEPVSLAAGRRKYIEVLKGAESSNNGAPA